MSQTRTPRRAAFGFVLATVTLDMLALGITIPVLPRLVLDFVGNNASLAADALGIFGTVFALMQFLAAPVLGVLSDRFGRRPIILLSNIGLGLDYLIMGATPTIYLLFVGRIIAGITSSSMTIAGAYIADVKPPAERASSFGLLSVAFGFGFVIGPAIGGILGQASPRLPFFVAGALSLLNAAYGYFVLPESLPKRRRQRFKWTRANPIGALNLLRSHPELTGLAAIAFLNYLAFQSVPAIFVLYGDFRYGWNTAAVGLALAAIGLSAGFIGGALVAPAVRYLGEPATLTLGIAGGCAGFLIFALAKSGNMFLIGIPIWALSGLANPVIQAIMSRRVGPSDQGLLQGASSSLFSTSGLIGPLLFTLTFSAAINPHSHAGLPGAPFLLAAALALTSIPIVLRTTRT